MISLLHVSDVHFGPKQLPELAHAVLEIARRGRPAALIVSGDLTQRAKPSQFRAAGDWIRDAPCPVAFVPGNHDVPMYRFWERFGSPFGAWRRWFDRELVREVQSDELAICGLNTAHAWTTKHGRVDLPELAAAGARLDSAPPGAFRVLVAHHPLAYAPAVGDEPVARRGDDAIELCRRTGVELVLSGHLHHGFWFWAGSGERVPGPLVLHAGTSSSNRGRGPERGRCSLNWIAIDTESIAVERRYWQAATGAFATEASARFERRPPESSAARVS